MAKELQRLYQTRIEAEVGRSEQALEEGRKIEVRIERLKERLRQGGPDMEPDELRAAIDSLRPSEETFSNCDQGMKEAAKFTTVVPKAAELYRKQIDEGLGGFAAATDRARLILREMLGEIRLQPKPGGELWASYRMSPALLIKSAGTGGRGDPISRVPVVPLDARLK